MLPLNSVIFLYTLKPLLFSQFLNLQVSTNFRPSHFYPLLVKLLSVPLCLSFLDENNTFIPEQFGSRINHSTLHKLLRVVEFLGKNLNTKTPSAVVFLEAFDKVWHGGLIYKLIKLK